jgi:uncharacterized protein YcbX
MKVGVLQEIRRYPVKSMAGESLDQVELASRGLPGDRAWAARDEVRGGIRGGKKIPSLMQLSARYPSKPAAEGSSPAEITLPSGATVETGDPDVNSILSKVLEHEVSLWPLLPADSLDHYRRGAPSHDDMETELRAIFARTADEPLPDLSIFPPEILEFESPPGSYFDAFPLLVMSEASLTEMGRRSAGSVFDVRRFRPNFVVADTGEALFPEMAWRGKRLSIGDAIIEMTVECPRCVMTTHGFADLAKDPSIMRSLVKQTGGNLGVYAKVESPGRMRVGDSIEVLD